MLSLVSLLLPLIINRSAAYEPKRIFTLQPFHFHGCPRKGLFTPSQLHSVTSLAVQAFAMLKAMAADSIAVVNAASLVPSIYKKTWWNKNFQIICFVDWSIKGYLSWSDGMRSFPEHGGLYSPIDKLKYVICAAQRLCCFSRLLSWFSNTLFNQEALKKRDIENHMNHRDCNPGHSIYCRKFFFLVRDSS